MGCHFRSPCAVIVVERCFQHIHAARATTNVAHRWFTFSFGSVREFHRADRPEYICGKIEEVGMATNMHSSASHVGGGRRVKSPKISLRQYCTTPGVYH